jgi:hypothetical protein
VNLDVDRSLDEIPRKEIMMAKRLLFIGLAVFLLALPLTVLAANVPVKVFENGANNAPIAVSGVKVEVFGGYGFKALLSSGVSGSDGGAVLSNVPLGKDIIVRLTKADYVTQYDIRSYSETDVEKGVVLWIGSETNVMVLYKNLGEVFDGKKGQVYLEINDEFTGEGIEGIQIITSSGKAFDLGQGEYLIANAEGNAVKIAIQKPGYAFDVESTTVPLFPGTMTQAYLNVQSGGAVYQSGQVTARVTSAMITGHILRLSDTKPVSGVTVAFTTRTGTARPSVLTDKTGFYKQTQFPVNKSVTVTPTSKVWKFKPAKKNVFVRSTGSTADFKAFQ